MPGKLSLPMLIVVLAGCSAELVGTAEGGCHADGCLPAPAPAPPANVDGIGEAADTGPSEGVADSGVAASPPPAAGTGTAHGPSHLSKVTGGGPMPSWTGNVVMAACAGDGVSDDSACLQAAANSARDQGRPLVIPRTSSFYKISKAISIHTSVGGVGGMPTIKQVNPAGDRSAVILRLESDMTGWIHNLHLTGTFTGSGAAGEWAHNLELGSVSGVTIKGNLLESPLGDCIGTDWTRFDSGNHRADNVLVDGNTMRNPWRCAIALVSNHDGWVITNNIIDKQVNYVSAIDYEPEGQSHVWNIEVAYNKFVMNNRTPYDANRGSDGKAISSWLVPGNPYLGGNFYHHHNYGSFGTGFGSHGEGVSNLVEAFNAEGPSPP